MTKWIVCATVSCLLVSHLGGQTATVTKVAGNGSSGFSGDGGPATSAALYFNEDYPAGIAVDALGNLFIADGGNARIRKVSPNGVITTFAGGGHPWEGIGDGGPATSAALGFPSGVALDTAGNLYIADGGFCQIRKVSASGIITTVAGNGTCGFSGDNGSATSASLWGSGVAVDASGNIFIADYTNNRVRKVSTSGIISTVAGNGVHGFSGDGGPAPSAELAAPWAVAVDTTGNIYIADYDNSRVRKVSTGGVITTVAGNGFNDGPLGDGGLATLAVVSVPTGVVVDSGGNLFIADRDDFSVRKVSPSGTITTVAAGLGLTLGVALDGAGNVFTTTTNGAQGAGEVLKLSAPTPSVAPGAVVPVDGTAPTIESGEWVSIFGSNLASSATVWKGDFPISLGGTSVMINGRAAYLSYVSPGQINLQAPDDAATGSVPVVVTTAFGTATSTVTLAPFAPSFLLFDTKHVAGIILRSDGSGAYGGGTYDILGPTGTSLGYRTVAAKAGDIVELFGTGFGPTNPSVSAGQAFSGAAATTNPVNLLLGTVSVAPMFSGLSSAGLCQINLIIPTDLGSGDVQVQATVGGAQTPAGSVVSLQ